MGCIGGLIKGICLKNLLTHTISLPSTDIEMYLDSIEDKAMKVCFLDIQETAPPPKVKIHPLVDFESSFLEVQSASE